MVVIASGGTDSLNHDPSIDAHEMKNAPKSCTCHACRVKGTGARLLHSRRGTTFSAASGSSTTSAQGRSVDDLLELPSHIRRYPALARISAPCRGPFRPLKETKVIKLTYVDEDEIEYDGGRRSLSGAPLLSKAKRTKSGRRFICLGDLEQDINLVITDATTKPPLEPEKWFGTDVLGGPGRQAFLERIAKIYDSCIASTLNLRIFGPTDTGGSALVAGPLEDNNSAIVLKKNFGDEARVWGEDVLTLVHEITHKKAVLGTIDVMIDEEQAAYQWYAVELAEANETDLCLQNAESWAYFLVQGAVYPRVTGLTRSGPLHWSMCHYKNVLGLKTQNRQASNRPRAGIYNQL